jgi:NAD(P)-dependent dehydrogenase (short-subunit alcohol dehydrogenase family)
LTIVVTGGGASVGRAIAEKFANEGHKTYVCDVVPGHIEKLGDERPDISGAVVDVTDPRSVEAFFGRILEEHPAVSVLVNGVGVAGPRAAIEDVTYEEWDATFRGCVDATFFCIKQVVPGMKAQRAGSIINFSTSSTKTGLPYRTPYVAAKIAIEGLTRNLARELGPFNIRCNAILPGGINNERLFNVLRRAAEQEGTSVEALLDDSLKYVSMRTLIEIDEFASLAWFLASDEARHLTGQLIALDGNAEWEE